MRFLVRKRRTTPAVIIVALIDVLIVLVIFLLVTTTFRQHPQLKLDLPESSQTQKPGATENPPLDVWIGKDGSIRLSQGTGNADPVTFDQLVERLRDAVANNPDTTVEINADENAPWGKVVRVRDAAVEAKIKKLVANTKEKAKP